MKVIIESPDNKLEYEVQENWNQIMYELAALERGIKPFIELHETRFYDCRYSCRLIISKDLRVMRFEDIHEDDEASKEDEDTGEDAGTDPEAMTGDTIQS